LRIRHIDFGETKQTNLQGLLYIILPIFLRPKTLLWKHGSFAKSMGMHFMCCCLL
jgi:hypothetical protein